MAAADMQQHSFVGGIDDRRRLDRRLWRRGVIKPVARTKMIEPSQQARGKPSTNQIHVGLENELSTRENTTLRTVSAWNPATNKRF